MAVPCDELDERAQIPRFLFGEIKFVSKFGQELGSGSQGDVRLGFVPRMGLCAVKTMRGAVKIASNRSKNEYRELICSMKLAHHQNIVGFYGFLHDGSLDSREIGFIMEYMRGGCVSYYIRNEPNIEERRIVSWGRQIANALAYIHSRNVVHRDVKPENMLLSADFKTIKLCDFGIACDIRQNMTTLIGTFNYTAPEVLSPTFLVECYDSKADVYSFAMSVWEFYHKEFPFSEEGDITRKVTLFAERLYGHDKTAPARPLIRSPMNDVMKFIIETCWATYPADRLPMDTVCDLLDVACSSMEINDYII